ncbi:putative protein C [Durham virus]|uniref:Uncharacterized protein n=1 Tax=Durham virus TaxID=710545 RepID=D6C4E5_9RHAB|nr:putative protein C [Durham virus]ADB88760.1 putative protein C [Durham virus]
MTFQNSLTYVRSLKEGWMRTLEDWAEICQERWERDWARFLIDPGQVTTLLDCFHAMKEQCQSCVRRLYQMTTTPAWVEGTRSQIQSTLGLTNSTLSQTNPAVRPGEQDPIATELVALSRSLDESMEQACQAIYRPA